MRTIKKTLAILGIGYAGGTAVNMALQYIVANNFDVIGFTRPLAFGSLLLLWLIWSIREIRS